MADSSTISQQRSLAGWFTVVKNPCFSLGWLGLIVISYFFVDQPLAWYMHNLPHSWLTKAADIVTQFGLAGYYCCFLLVLYGIARWIVADEQLKHIAILLFIAIIIPGIICDILKIFVGRSRPIMLFQYHDFGFKFFKLNAVMWSFPSGHATVIAGFMMMLSVLFEQWWGLFALMAFLVGISRVVVCAHFLSDVMMGWYLGAMIVVGLAETLQIRSGQGRV